MSKQKFLGVLMTVPMLAFALALPMSPVACLAQTLAESNNPKPVIATVNYGKILFKVTNLAAYEQTENGTMIPSTKLSDEEVEKLSEASARMHEAIESVIKQHDISLVIRLNSRPEEMRHSISSAAWKPDPDAPITVMNEEESKTYKRQQARVRLMQDLDARIAAHVKTDLTSMVIAEMRKTAARSK